MEERDLDVCVSWAALLALIAALVWAGSRQAPQYQPPAPNAEAEALEDLLYLAPILFP